MQHAKKNSVLANSHQLSHQARRKGLWGVGAYEDEQATFNPGDTKTYTLSKEYMCGCQHTDTHKKRPAKMFYHICAHTCAYACVHTHTALENTGSSEVTTLFNTQSSPPAVTAEEAQRKREPPE